MYKTFVILKKIGAIENICLHHKMNGITFEVYNIWPEFIFLYKKCSGQKIKKVKGV